jgi:hypothetical protein
MLVGYNFMKRGFCSFIFMKREKINLKRKKIEKEFDNERNTKKKKRSVCFICESIEK